MARALALLLAALHARSLAFDISQCIAPLGMESGQIPDEAITASSCYNDGNVAPHNGRLRVERAGGAWCPRAQASPETAEWLEVDLRGVHVVTAVATQGRFGNGQGQEYAEAYALEYWRPRLGKWVRYRTLQGQEILPGNSNTYLEVKNQLSPAIWASKVRFLPHSNHRRTVCMRVELYGCMWNEGIVSYSMPAGDTRSNGVRLADATYDGEWSGGELRAGLGQLVDGERGGDELRDAARPSPWVGWRNDSARAPPALTFEFDRVREFTALVVHTNNRFMRDVRAFSAAVVRFSVGGRHYQREAVRLDVPPDDIFESARDVTVPLRRRIGRWVRVELHFAARWLLVSEVAFESEPARGEHPAERAAPAAGRGPGGAPVHTARREEPLYVAVAVGVLTALAILAAVAALLLVRRHRHRKCSASPLADSTARRRPTDDLGEKACSLPAAAADDYQEPYRAPSPAPLPYGTPPLELRHVHSESTLALDDCSNYEYAVPETSSAPLLGEPQPHLTTGSSGGASGRSSAARRIADVPELSPHRLRLISKLAEGAFGTVYVAEGEGVPEYGGEEEEEADEGPRLVAVKFLHAAATPEEVSAFARDVRVLAALAHPCLARVLAAARSPPALVLEYAAPGDLHAALRGTPPRSPPPRAALLSVARQLAAGMAYLEALGFVHRDLAARNCVLGARWRVKIADFGTDNEAYAADYVRIEGRAVPLRWAAPEAALLGEHSTRSDAWAWAVTVNEVLWVCRRRPLERLSDERVLAALRRLAAGARWEPPERAPACPPALHALLLRCWRREPRLRPAFRDLHAALEHPDFDD